MTETAAFPRELHPFVDLPRGMAWFLIDCSTDLALDRYYYLSKDGHQVGYVREIRGAWLPSEPHGKSVVMGAVALTAEDAVTLVETYDVSTEE